MEFPKYGEMLKPQHPKSIEAIKSDAALMSALWIATEKVHGCNVRIMTDGKDIFQVGSREKELEEGESFFDIWNNINKVKDKLKAIALEVGQTMVFFLEYYSGDKSIVAAANIPYRNDKEKEFVAFDMYNADLSKFVNHDEAYALFAKHGVPTTSVYAKGTFDTLFNLPNNYDSMLAKEQGINVKAEGIVLRTAEESDVFYEGVRINRALLKRPSESFKETKVKDENKPKQAFLNLTPEQAEAVNNCITDVRLGAQAAKHGFTPGDGKINDLKRILALDIMKDVNLGEEYLDAVTKMVSKICFMFHAKKA